MRDATSAHAASSLAALSQLTAREAIDLIRVRASNNLDPSRRAERGQFFTPPHVARLMASMLRSSDEVVLLDPGSGSGVLLGAAVLELIGRDDRPSSISATAAEADEALLPDLHATIGVTDAAAASRKVALSVDVETGDFIERNVQRLRGGFFAEGAPRTFTHAIMNPPYGKVRADSETRQLLDALGVGSGNLYTGFLAVVVELLAPGGELVAITPRSFCNGPYFKTFRRWFLSKMSLQEIHVFESRSIAFKDDAVLQENVVIHAVKTASRPSFVTVSSSSGDVEEAETSRQVPYNSVVRSDDLESFIHIVPDETGEQIVQAMASFTTTLEQLNVSVSTGRVVDFRVRELLKQDPEDGTVPLIYPTHFDNGIVAWPKKGSKKPNAIRDCIDGDTLSLPEGNYVLVRRFSAKEEPRRIVAALYDFERVSSGRVAFENHLNYFHASGKGLPRDLAAGLALYLNSSVVDQFFRHFSGHTQVNATDLRRLGYPSRHELDSLGRRVQGDAFPTQSETDQILREEFPSMAQARDPIKVSQRVEEAQEVLRALDFPRAQLNQRSALTLLALVGLKSSARWSRAADPLRGITPIMEFIRDEYGRSYKPNSRETIRRETMHQFVEAGIAIPNPDNSGRPVNSPGYVYQIEPAALELLRTYKTASWKKNLAAYLASVETLRSRYAQERTLTRIELKMPDSTLLISPGGQNLLIQQIIDEFCPRFTPGGTPLYIGDAGEKFAYFEEEALARLGVHVNEHGKMPDVIVHHTERDWLVLIEAVTSHGPVNPKRHNELKAMFSQSSAGLVFVTAFLSRQAMASYLAEIAWETEVWSADDASHLIHFNGERFLALHQ